MRRDQLSPPSAAPLLEPLEARRLLTVSVSGLVWGDLNSNGIRDTGEPGLAGAVVEVFSSTDTTIGNADDVSRGLAVTAANGSYAFAGLPEGFNYYEVFRTPAGYTFTAKNAGTDPTRDSDANSTGVTAIFTVAPGSSQTLDAGLKGAAPWFGFALRAGGQGVDEGQAVATDAAGNVYLAGRFSGTADFDPGPGTWNQTSAGGYDIFVAKYSAAGALQWARSLGGTGDDYGYGLAVPSDGSVYTTGYFNGTADFDPGPGAYNLTSAGSADIFVSRLDSAGNFVWAGAFGGTRYDVGNGLALAADGSVYTTGYFQGTADFDPGPSTFNLTSARDITYRSDVFVSKLDSAGNFVWARRFGGTSDDEGTAVAVAADGSVYTMGVFAGTADFDPGTGTFNLASAGSYNDDVFVSKLDSAGNFVWARRLGGYDYDYGQGIAVAADGSVYTTGFFQGTADFDPGPGTFNLTVAGSYDVFICKLGSAGNFVWARSLGGPYTDTLNGLAVAADGSVYTTGRCAGKVDFDPGPGTFYITSAVSYGGFFSKLDSSGNFVWATSLQGAGAGNALAVASDGSVYSTGYFSGTADFDPGLGTFNLTSAGNNDVFMSKLLPPQAPTAMALAIDRVLEDRPVGTPLGVFSATDPDPGDVFQFSLVPGLGDSDNAAFSIGANVVLMTNAVFDFHTKSSYSIRVRAADHAGAALERAFTVSVVAGTQGASLGDWVWRDLDGDGLQDAGEPGLAGVGIEAFSTADHLSRGLAVTDANGQFALDHLLPGIDYELVFRAPVGSTFTTQNAGTDRTRDNDANSTGVTAIPALAPGESRTAIDAGLVGTAPWFGFALRVGTINYAPAWGQAVATDATGNVYVTGSFEGTPDFDPGPGTLNLTEAGYEDVFVAKYSALGALLWARRLGGTDYDYAFGVAVASDGSVYTTGYFRGTADFDPGPGTFDLTSAGGLKEVFVSKLDSAGSFVWARSLGGTGDDDGHGIAVASDGSVYTTGHFNGTADFDPGPGTYNLSGHNQVFVSKLDCAGNFVWARSLGGASYDYSLDLAVASDGSVYTAGEFLGTADFDPGPGTFNLTSAGQSDVFICKLDSAGNFVWAGRLGGTSADIGSDLAVASDGSVYTTGYFQGTADFDPGSGTLNLTSAGGDDVFVSKLDSWGRCVWAKRLGGTDYDQGYGLAVASNGSVYTTGHFYGTADFDPGPGTFSLTSASGSSDVFVSKLDSAGNFVWARRLGGTGFDCGKGVAVAADGSVCTTGYFQGVADFDPGPGTFNLTASGYEDVFVYKVLPPQAPTDVSLSSTSVAENQPSGTVVGTLSSTDPETGNGFTYTLVSGTGGADNSAFSITGNVLKTAAVFNRTVKSQYSIRVRTTDDSGLWFEKAITIQVTAAPMDWTGTVDDRWENGANWWAGIVPGLQTQVRISGAAVRQPVLYQNQTVRGLDLGSGAVCAFAPGAPKTLVTRSLTIAETAGMPTARLDIGSGAIVIDYTGQASPFADLQRWINQAYHDGAWDGKGITSSAFAERDEYGNLKWDPGMYAIGYADNGQMDDTIWPFWFGDGSEELGPKFGNVNPVAVPRTAALVKFTFIGDLNLDGRVDDNDATILGLYYNNDAMDPNYSNHEWCTGDILEYDGTCNDNDVTAFGNMYGMGWLAGYPL